MSRRRNNAQTVITVFCTLLQLVYSKSVGDECDFGNGTQGFCVGIKDCQEAIKLLNVNKTLKVCSYINEYPVVCCNDTKIVATRGVKSLKYCQEYQIMKLPQTKYVGGGKDCRPKEFPHMAALGFDNNNEIIWGCGGSLISLKFVLTAAHCLDNLEYGPVKHVRLGDLNLKSDEDDAEVQDFLVTKTYKHPQYKRPSKYHDIALVELDRDAKVTDYVKIACLNVIDIPKDNVYITIGWGLLSFHGTPANILQKVHVREVNNSACNNFYEVHQRFYNSGIVESTQICAGEPGKDTCKGDSGGPLQIRNRNYLKAYDIHGVTSFGKACLLTNSPGVYTRVSYYIDWIESIVWP